MIDDHGRRARPPANPEMHALGRDRRRLDGRRRRALLPPHRLGEGGRGRLFLHPDFRQPHRLREARQSGCARDARRRDRQDPGDAGQSGVHDPYRRHQPYAPSRSEFDDALADASAGRSSTSIMRPASTTSSTPKTRTAYLERFGKGATGGGWYAFDHGGVHFVSLINVVDLKKNGLGSLGADQLAWLEDDLSGKIGFDADRPLLPISRFWMIAPEWGWGTEDSAQALALLVALRLGDRAQRPHSSTDAEGRRRTSLSTPPARPPFPQPAPGTAPSPGPEARAGRRIAQVARRPGSRLLACARPNSPSPTRI